MKIIKKKPDIINKRVEHIGTGYQGVVCGFYNTVYPGGISKFIIIKPDYEDYETMKDDQYSPKWLLNAQPNDFIEHFDYNLNENYIFCLNSKFLLKYKFLE